MITNSDIIMKTISQKGYNMNSFCKASGIKQRAFCYAVDKNSWTKPMLSKVSEFLGINLMGLVNATVGNTDVH